MTAQLLNRHIALIAAGLVAGALGVAWYHGRSAHAVERELGATSLRLRTLATSVQSSQVRLAEAQDAREKQQAALEALQARATFVRKAAAPSGRVQRGPTLNERLQTEPDTQLYWLAAQRSEAAAKYGPFFRQTGLSPAHGEKFHGALIRRQEQVMDLISIVRT
jgi:hypothetical protein